MGEELASLDLIRDDRGNSFFRLHAFLGKRHPRALPQMLYDFYHRRPSGPARKIPLKSGRPGAEGKMHGTPNPKLFIDAFSLFVYFRFRNPMGDRSTVGQRTLTP